MDSYRYVIGKTELVKYIVEGPLEVVLLLLLRSFLGPGSAPGTVIKRGPRVSSP